MLWSEDEDPPENRPFFPEPKMKYDPGGSPTMHPWPQPDAYRPPPPPRRFDLQHMLQSDNVIERAVHCVASNQEHPVRHSLDFDRGTPASVPNKQTKQRAIFTKNMFQTMPKLVWLPGDFHMIRDNDSDADAIQSFCQTARTFRVVSLMIFAEVESVYRVALFTLSTPLCTLLFDVRSRGNRSISLPKDVYEMMSQPGITVVCPGAKDWHYSSTNNHLSMLRDIVSPMPSIAKIQYLQEFENSLALNRSGKDICMHMRMLHWLFQVKIDIQYHGGTIRSAILTQSWQQFADLYGKLLIYLYWALQRKQELFDKNPRHGVNMSPIYLEELIIQKRLSDITDRNELQRKLLGSYGQYPDPPLPRINA